MTSSKIDREDVGTARQGSPGKAPKRAAWASYYSAWIAGQRSTTERTVQAESQVAARRIYARLHTDSASIIVGIDAEAQ